MTHSSDQPPLHEIKLEAHGCSDVGQKRPHNEDSILVDRELNLFAVADGMGGHAAGEVASNMAIEGLKEFIGKTQTDKDFTWPFGMQEGRTIGENLIETAVQIANRKVCNVAMDNSAFLGMGTTLVAMYLHEGALYLAHVGDSRIYRQRGEGLELLTTDHSWVNEQLQRNIITEKEARTHRWRNVITRALGNRQEIEVDLLVEQPQAGDVYLMCSDGLTSMVEDEVIDGVIRENHGNLEGACNKLVDAANQAGGMDNISVILVRVEAPEA